MEVRERVKQSRHGTEVVVGMIGEEASFLEEVIVVIVTSGKVVTAEDDGKIGMGEKGEVDREVIRKSRETLIDRLLVAK